MSEEIVKQQQPMSLNIFQQDTFNTMIRVADTFSTSLIVPSIYRKVPNDEKASKQATANCFIALQMACELGINPMTTMQNLYIVNGKPAWSSTFIISCFNTCGRFTPLMYLDNFDKEKDRTKWWCMATAKDKQGNVYKGTKITWTMAEAEGWTKKPGSKWVTMPEQMFKYRAAAFFIRAVAPEILMGFRPIDEVEDIEAAEQQGKQAAIVDATYTVENAVPDYDVPDDKKKFGELVDKGMFAEAKEMLDKLKANNAGYSFVKFDAYLSAKQVDAKQATAAK